jgi:hypothetical protein
MTVRKLMRFGVSVALVGALAATAACGQKTTTNATNATNTTTTTTTTTTNTAALGGLGLGAFNGTTAAPANGGMANDGSMPNGATPNMPNGGMPNGGMANNGGMGDTSGMNGGAGGMNGGGDGGMANNGGNMQAMNQQWDQANYTECVREAVNSAPPQVAQQYCACVINALEPIPVQQKMQMTVQSPQMAQAINMCRPH